MNCFSIIFSRFLLYLSSCRSNKANDYVGSSGWIPEFVPGEDKIYRKRDGCFVLVSLLVVLSFIL